MFYPRLFFYLCFSKLCFFCVGALPSLAFLALFLDLYFSTLSSLPLFCFSTFVVALRLTAHTARMTRLQVAAAPFVLSFFKPNNLDYRFEDLERTIGANTDPVSGQIMGAWG